MNDSIVVALNHANSNVSPFVEQFAIIAIVSCFCVLALSLSVFIIKNIFD